MKVLENTPAVLWLGKLCDENGYSYESINGQKPHLTKDGIRIQCNTEKFVPIVVPGLSSSSSGSLSTSKTLSKQESHSSLSSSPTASEIQIREREDGNNSDISPVQVSNSFDDRSGQPDETTIDRGNSLNSEIPESRRIRAKPKLHKKPREACTSSWNPRNLKVIYTDIPWNSAKLVKISSGIIARLHHTDRRLMVLPKEQCAE